MNQEMNFACFICICFVIYNKVGADEVPSILWNIKGNTLPISSTPAFGESSNTFDKIIQNNLNGQANILVFVLNKLSLEDFSTNDLPESTNSTLYNLQKYLDSQRYMFLSSVKNPLDRVHQVHCGVQEIMLDQSIDENVLQSVSLAFDTSCVVILHMTDIGVFGTKEPSTEDIKTVFQPDFKKLTKDVVGIFTSAKSSWSASSMDHIFTRGLLQTDEIGDANFVNISGCVYMYMENGTVQVNGNSTFTLPLPPDTTGSSCDNATAVLQLAFKLSGAVTSATLKFNFRNKFGSWVTDASITLEGDKMTTAELPLKADFITAPMKNSFNCGDLKLRYIAPKENSSLPDVFIRIKGFQVQPFPVSDKFSYSFDCVTFFTVPIWMGVFVSLLFIVIINVGVYALFSVHTMDRFDDPKKKTIAVAVAGE